MNGRTSAIVGAALAVACSAASGQTAVDPKASGEVTVQLQFENLPPGSRTSSSCQLTNFEPDVKLDGKVVSWRGPALSYVYDTGNPLTRGHALRISGVAGGRHTIEVALPSGTCPGYGWLPSNHLVVTLNSRNSYEATAKFNYTRMVTVPTPERPGTLPTKPPPIR
jgi:hypothetical protein